MSDFLHTLQNALAHMSNNHHSLFLHDVCMQHALSCPPTNVGLMEKEFWRDIAQHTCHGIELHKHEDKTIQLLPQRITNEFIYIDNFVHDDWDGNWQDYNDIEQHLVHVITLLPLWSHVDQTPLNYNISFLLEAFQYHNKIAPTHAWLDAVLSSVFNKPMLTTQNIEDTLKNERNHHARDMLDQSLDARNLPFWCHHMISNHPQGGVHWAQSVGMPHLAAQLSKEDLKQHVDMDMVQNNTSKPKLL